MTDVTIAGAGLAGLMTAYGLSERGVRAVLYDPAAQPGASWAAAGMLCPGFELLSESSVPDGMANIALLARRIWSDLAPALEAEAERPVGYSGAPGVLAVLDSDVAASDFERCGGACGVVVESAPAALAREVAHIPAGRLRLLPGDGWVDNRAVVSALRVILEKRGVEIRRALAPEPTRRSGVFVDARGWQAPGMSPVRGVALAVTPWEGAPSQPVRFGPSYIVPHGDRVVIGASVEPGRSDDALEGAALDALVAEANAIAPGAAGAKRLSAWSGVRPRSDDGLPVLGELEAGRFVIGGMHRNGVLLSPLLGAWLAMTILDGEVPAGAAGLTPRRFTGP